MKPADDIKQLFRNARLSIHPDTDEQVFKDVQQARRQTIKNPPAKPDNTWRSIMKSPTVKLAVAAAVVVVCLMGVSLWKHTGSGIALADVLARMEQIQVYRLQMTTMFQNEGGEDKPVAEATTLISPTLGQKITLRMDNPLTGQHLFQETFVRLPQRTMTMLMPDEKKYALVDLDDAAIEGWQAQNDPRRLVELVLKYEHTRLGRSVVDGVEVEGFHMTADASFFGEEGPLVGADIKIWADIHTKLPVRLEVDKSEPGKGRMCVVAHDFEWDVSVDASEFEPVIPDDYTPGQPIMHISPKK